MPRPKSTVGLYARSFRLQPADIARLEECAALTGHDLTSVFREALRRYHASVVREYDPPKKSRKKSEKGA